MGSVDTQTIRVGFCVRYATIIIGRAFTLKGIDLGRFNRPPQKPNTLKHRPSYA